MKDQSKVLTAEERQKAREFVATVMADNPGLCVIAKGSGLSFGNATQFVVQSFGKDKLVLKALPGTTMLSELEFKKRLNKLARISKTMEALTNGDILPVKMEKPREAAAELPVTETIDKP